MLKDLAIARTIFSSAYESGMIAVTYRRSGDCEDSAIFVRPGTSADDAALFLDREIGKGQWYGLDESRLSRR